MADQFDVFTTAYLEAMFWTECHSDNPELASATVADLAPETIKQIDADCQRFQDANAHLLRAAYLNYSYGDEMAGHDYWLTRNGHGAGFWDRGLGSIGNALTKACQYNSVDLYRGDDGLLYLA